MLPEVDMTTKRPNIVLVLADDMGYSDIGCFGSEIATPNLDRLASGGVRFSQMYNCARCCPTRASLMTGLHPHQAGIGHMVADDGVPAYQGYLRDDCPTVAERLRSAGYRTLMSGKWHVGGGYAANRPETWRPGEPGRPVPTQRGFDEYYGMLGGAGSYFNPPYMLRNESIIRPGDEGDYYLTDAISSEAARMIRRGAGSGKPFFLYLAYTAPHWPLHALPEDIERYRNRYPGGWDLLREERFERLRATGIIDPAWKLSPRNPKAPAWSEVPNREWEAYRMAVYAAQVDRLDRGIGSVVAALEESGEIDNTLIMFLSDNGGCAEFLAEDSGTPEPFRYNIPLPDGTPMRVGNAPHITPGGADTFASYDLPWANASNTPFRQFKRWIHEGGISTPFVAHWPARIAGGRICHGAAHITDITATCLAAAGGVAAPELEGESLLGAFAGEEWNRSRPIIIEHEGNCAVRQGQWKLVREHGEPWELYDMVEDRTELRDRAGGDANRVARMSRLFEEWSDRVGALPYEELVAARRTRGAKA
jgi:arylsulfatase A-like enzyme